jgi:hypothetical protein
LFALRHFFQGTQRLDELLVIRFQDVVVTVQDFCEGTTPIKYLS